MAQTFQGDVSFMLHNKLSPHRFEVSVTEERKMLLWIEDKESKKQWHTRQLDAQDFITPDNAIPKATVTDYAERFAACLSNKDETVKYGRSISTKGGERVLLLTLPLQWATCDLALEYKFSLKAVPLQHIDILGARLRDVEEKLSVVGEELLGRLEQENETVKSDAKRLGERVEELSRHVATSPAYAQARTTSHHSANQTLVWTAGDSDANGMIEIRSEGSVRFHAAGVYAIDIGITHAGTTNAVVFELVKARTVLASCQGCSMNSYYSTTPLRYILKAEIKDEISVIYKASGYAYAGSYITIVKL